MASISSIGKPDCQPEGTFIETLRDAIEQMLSKTYPDYDWGVRIWYEEKPKPQPTEEPV